MKKRISPFAIFSFVIFLVSLIMLALSRLSVELADFLNENISTPYRRAMAAFGELFDFSLFELLVILSPLLLALLIWRFIVVFKRGYGRTRLVTNVLAVALLLYSGNILALSISYNTTSVEKHLELPSVTVNEETLREATKELCLEINALSEKIEFSDGKSRFGYSLREASEKICESYAEISKKYGFIDNFTSHAKGVNALHFMSYLSLTGIYTYYTGESNVNTDYPEYDVVFTAAHELAHQRGVLRENEANFMAYLACSTSSDDYLRYSAALNMFSYVGTALWQTDPDGYYELLETLSDGARDDLRASNAVYYEYGETVLSDISSFVNDIFLKSNGTDGVVTYGRVVTLYMSYRAK